MSEEKLELSSSEAGEKRRGDMWCWAQGLECGVDKWKFLSPVLKQPRLLQQQQYEDFSILELLMMSALRTGALFFSTFNLSRFSLDIRSFGGLRNSNLCHRCSF